MNKYKEALWSIDFSMRYRTKPKYIRKVEDENFEILYELVEKATPKKPIGDLHSVPHYRCPICHGGVKMYEDSIVYPFCHHCGQAILWGKEDVD